ncbi:hypothetical protein ACH5RR_029498 [Cinchona calisaya]|uniref:Reverse transcriptase zinc-binding domain-containing protein n=1 Tax=Cinchona calisaya TaxID=153742 RepID=A0ABD2YV53_9GENT
MKQILQTKALVIKDVNDVLIWKLNSHGHFVISSTLSKGESAVSFSRRMIWDSKLQLKISIFMWLLLNNLLPLDDILSKFGILMASKCRFCDSQETLNHLFVECKWISQVWFFVKSLLEMSFPHSTQIEFKLNS